MTDAIDRRSLIKRGIAMGCSAAASPLVTPVTLAATPGDRRLVVIVLRGAMDGLDAVRPMGDRGLARHRPSLIGNGAEPGPALDDFYRFHPALSPLLPLWRDGQLGAVHAVSTPYRHRRSHFDGQDFLENGGFATDGQLAGRGDGWLNRLLTLMPGVTRRTAYAVGHDHLKLLEGPADVSSWSPSTRLRLSAQAETLLRLVYRHDPLFEDAAQTAFMIAEDEAAIPSVGKQSGGTSLGAFAARQLMDETRIAAFSIGGWDTHRRQAAAFPKALGNLSDAILALCDGLSAPAWSKTTIVAITEFGRTVRENGTRGTDHGTGGLMLFAGGATRGGQVAGQWPGLGDGQLFEDRDLLPTDDLRRYLGWMARDHLGLDANEIERTVFPSLQLGTDPGLIH